MDQLLYSRINNEEETRLENLSPEKFGRSAYAKLSYTPSKLANNVLYKEVTQMKKTEENGSKMREFQSLNQILKDKIRNLQAQKAGIEQSLTQQIIMYKKMVVEMEQGLEQRVKELQISFSEEIQRIIKDKQEEAKYVQSQKEMMENRIFELQNYIAELKQELTNRNNVIDKKNQEYEKLEIRFQSSQKTVSSLEKKLQESEVKSIKDKEEFNKKIEDQQSFYRNKFDKLQLDKVKQKQQLQTFFRGEIQKKQKQKAHELIIKNQELRDLTVSFENQVKQLNEGIVKKDQYIQTLSKNLNDQKQKLLKITKQYTVQVANLNNQKKVIEQQCQTVSKNLEKQKEQSKRIKTSSNQAQIYYKEQIEKLKKELDLTHLDLLKERQRFYLEIDDLKHEVLILRKNVEQNNRLLDQNSYLCKEVKNLKDILTESSLEMERCKEQFVRLGAEKDTLVVKLRELDMENQTLHRINIEREEEARTWRESYYKYRR